MQPKLMIKNIRERVEAEEHRFTIHALERCVERSILPEDVRHIILSGEIIEDYPEDKYGPSCLICGVTPKGKIMHVQCSIDPVWIITAYDPSLRPDEWEKDFKRRRNKS